MDHFAKCYCHQTFLVYSIYYFALCQLCLVCTLTKFAIFGNESQRRVLFALLFL